MSLNDSKIAKIQAHFKTLASVAPALNAATDELNKSITILDEALKKLNVGLSAWVTFRSRGEDESDYDDDQIGYTKVDGKWGIALRRIWGDNLRDTFYCDGPWLFNDGPRELRLLGVDRIPDVIESLGKQASVMTKKVQDTAKEVRELADVVGDITREKTPFEKSLQQGLTDFRVAGNTSKHTQLSDLLGKANEGSK